MRSIDLNCDMGEGCGNDEQLLALVSSANIACGFHAGDSETMRRTAAAAISHGVAIGAHPSYPDRRNFGRTSLQLSPAEVFDIVSEQILYMKTICEAEGGKLGHVKPHGALYNEAARDPDLASAIAEAIKNIDTRLLLYGLSGSTLISAGNAAGLKTASEVFADRTYSPDGSLTPRTLPNALISEPRLAAEQVIRMIESSNVVATDNSIVRLQVDTVCIHGDGQHAVEFAHAIRAGLEKRGVEIKAIFR